MRNSALSSQSGLACKLLICNDVQIHMRITTIKLTGLSALSRLS